MTRLLFAVPNPTPDPFAPDPTIFPEAPPWLFPLTMVLLAIAVMVVLVLLYMWNKANQFTRAERERLRNKDWIDLSLLDKTGRWREQADSPPVPDDPDDSADTQKREE